MVTFCPLTEAKVRAHYQTTCTSFSSGGGRRVEEREILNGASQSCNA